MSINDQLAAQFGGGGGGSNKRKASGSGWQRDWKRQKWEEEDTGPAIEEEVWDDKDDGWRLTLNLNPLKSPSPDAGGAQLRRAHVYTAQQPEDRRRWLKHGCFLKSCRWAPDGSVLLANSEDNVLRLFNLPDSLRSLNADTLRTDNVAPAPGPGVYTVKQDPNPSPALLEKSLEMTEGECVYDYAWYPKMSERTNCCFAASSRDHPIHLWDALSGDLRATYRAYNNAGEPTSAFSLAFSHDGTTLAAGYRSTMRFFDAETAGEATTTRATHFKIKKKKTGLCGLISTVDWSPRHPSLYAAATFTSQFGIGDLRTPGRSVSLVMKAHKGGITHLKFSPCGRYVYTAARKDGEIKGWDIRLAGASWNGKYREALALDAGMSREVPTNQRVTFDLDASGEYLYSGCHSGVVKVWRVPSGTEAKVVKVGTEPVNGVALHPTLPILTVTTGERRFQIPAGCDREGVIVQGWRGGDCDSSSSSSSDSDSDSASGSVAADAPADAGATDAPMPDVKEEMPVAAVKPEADMPPPRPPIDDLVSTCSDAMFVSERAEGTNNIRSTLEIWTGQFLHFRTNRAIEHEKKVAAAEAAAAEAAAAAAVAAAEAAAAAAAAPETAVEAPASVPEVPATSSTPPSIDAAPASTSAPAAQGTPAASPA